LVSGVRGPRPVSPAWVFHVLHGGGVSRFTPSASAPCVRGRRGAFTRNARTRCTRAAPRTLAGGWPTGRRCGAGSARSPQAFGVLGRPARARLGHGGWLGN